MRFRTSAVRSTGRLVSARLSGLKIHTPFEPQNDFITMLLAPEQVRKLKAVPGQCQRSSGLKRLILAWRNRSGLHFETETYNARPGSLLVTHRALQSCSVMCLNASVTLS